MKNSLLLLIVAFLVTGTLNANYYLATADSFTFEGFVQTTSNVNLSGVILNVYQKNGNDKKKVSAGMSNFLGKFFIYLKHNVSYEIELMKKGFQNQWILIDTKVLPETIKDGGIGVAYDNKVTVYEYFPGVDYSFFNKPVEFWEYDSKQLFFNKNLNKAPVAKLNKIAPLIAEKKQEVFNRLKVSGDSAFAFLKYDKAVTIYSEALQIFPDDKSVGQSLADAKKLLKKGKNADQKYKELMTEADQYFEGKKYPAARESYLMARNYNEKDTRAISQLSKIDSIAALQYQQKLLDELLANQRLFEKNRLDSINLLRQNAIRDSILLDEKKMKEEEDKQKKQKEVEGKTAEEKRILAEKENKEKMAREKLAQERLAREKYIKDSIKQSLLSKKQKVIEEKAAKEKRLIAEKETKEKLAREKMTRAKFIKDSIRQLELSKNKDKKTETQELDEKKDDKVVVKKTIVEMLASALKLEKGNKKDDAARMYIEVAEQYNQEKDLGSSLNNYNKALNIYKKSGDKVNVAFAMSQISAVMLDSGLYKQSIDAKKEVLQIKRELGDTKGELELMKEMGEIYINTYKPDEAEAIYIEMLIKTNALKDLNATAEITEKLGDLYTERNDYENAIDFYTKAIEIAKEQKNLEQQGTLYNNVGVVNLKNGKYDEAIQYFTQTLEIEKKSGNKQNASYALNNIGNINFERKQYNTAILYYEKALKLKKETKNEEAIATSLFNIANAYLIQKNYAKAKEYFLRSLEICISTNFREGLAQNYRLLSRLYDETQKYKDAVGAFKNYFKLASYSSFAEGPITETRSMYSYEKGVVSDLRRQLQKQRILTDYESMQNLQKQQQLELKELELKNQEAQVLRQRILLIFTLVCLILAIFMGYQIYIRYKEKKQYAEVIAFQHKQITDSITYARRIQQAVLPPSNQVKDCLHDGFVLSKPKDIVSGDFYYTKQKGDLLYIVVADCTGHGVPGAFMSMLSLSILKDIISHDETCEAKTILEKLRESIIQALNQSGKDDEAKDGMDLSLVIIDSKNKKLKYAGANNKGLIINNQTITELLADRMPIGIHPVMKPFKEEIIDLKPNDTLYLYSDGFCDQIGGESRKKFKIRQFVQLLLEINHLPLNEQQQILETRLEQWKGDVEQTDDITVLGYKM